MPVLRGGPWRHPASTRKTFVADQVAVNHRKADITPRQHAMLDFAMKVCLQSHEINDADFEALHAHGFDDEDIWDIAAITAFFWPVQPHGQLCRHATQPRVLPDGRCRGRSKTPGLIATGALLDKRWRPIRLKFQRCCARCKRALRRHQHPHPVRQGHRLCCGKSTQMVVAPPAAYTTPGWSLRSSVHQASKVVRPGRSYIFASTSPGYSSCL